MRDKWAPYLWTPEESSFWMPCTACPAWIPDHLFSFILARFQDSILLTSLSFYSYAVYWIVHLSHSLRSSIIYRKCIFVCFRPKLIYMSLCLWKVWTINIYVMGLQKQACFLDRGNSPPIIAIFLLLFFENLKIQKWDVKGKHQWIDKGNVTV